MRMFSDLEYIRAKDGIIYLVKGPYHPAAGVFAYPVYWPDPAGERVHPKLGRYRKEVSDINEKIFELHPEYRHDSVPRQTPLVLRTDIVEVFEPRKRIESFLETEQSIWRDIFEYLADEIGIPRTDLGIFGSYLVNLHKDKKDRHVKDIDMAVYGIQNYRRVRTAMPRLLAHFEFGRISADHIQRHVRKYGALLDPAVNSLEQTLGNKWSSMQLAPGLLNTLRFVYKPGEVPPNPLSALVERPSVIEGVVTDDEGTNFMPRVFSLRTNQPGPRTYHVVTYFWMFQACVRIGQRVRVTGNLHADGHTISVDERAHGIRILPTLAKDVVEVGVASRL